MSTPNRARAKARRIRRERSARARAAQKNVELSGALLERGTSAAFPNLFKSSVLAAFNAFAAVTQGASTNVKSLGKALAEQAWLDPRTTGP